MEAKLRVKLEEGATAPRRTSEGAAGYDLYAYNPDGRPLFLEKRLMVRTGCSVAIPPGYYGRIAERSSLAWKYGVSVGGGVIDCDYRGEVKVILSKDNDMFFSVRHGDRIAQLILEKISTPEVEVVESLDDTERGEGGFGSTGLNDTVKD